MRESKIDDLRIIEEPDVLFESGIVLAGAGRNGIYASELLSGSGLRILGFCDNDRKLQGTWIAGTSFQCYSFEEIADRYQNGESIRFILTTHCDALLRQLAGMDVDAGDVNTLWALRFSICLNISNPHIGGEYRDNFVRKYRRWVVLERARFLEIHAMDNYIRTWRRTIQENPVLVYQFGKVGSQSVYKGLEALHIPVEQSHALVYEEAFMGPEMRDLYQLFLQSVKEKASVKIINIVREPIARDISNIFELWDVPFIKMFEQVSGRLLDSICDILLNKVVTSREELCRLSPVDIHYGYKLRGLNGDIFQWYDDELRRAFGIDVLQYPFDCEKGYGIIRQGNIEVLLLSLEKLGQNEEVVGSFIGNGNFKLCNANQAEQKGYRYLYENVKEKIELPSRYVDRYYLKNPYVSHFYAEDSREAFCQKWTGGQTKA